MKAIIEIKTPKPPNFLIDTCGHAHDVAHFTEAELKSLAKDWEKQLLEHAKKRKKMLQNPNPA